VQDTWLADRLGASELGKTAGQALDRAALLPGKTTRRALVIAACTAPSARACRSRGCWRRTSRRRRRTSASCSSRCCSRQRGARQARHPRGGQASTTNRNFPDPGKDLAASGGKDATGRDILPENQLLMQLMERFKPERIISLHGTQHPEKAGVFYDPRKLTPEEELESARSAAASAGPRPSDSEGSSEARFRTLYDRSVADKLAAAGAADKDLSLRAAS
jgi:hypothetical protein